MKIIVTGAGGQLGAELCRQLGDEAIGLRHGDLDIGDRQAVARVVSDLRPDAVINCAAYTQVDKAETDVERCRAINADAVGFLADACREVNASLVQISTDYVFGAEGGPRQPHRETDPTHPQGIYAQTKLAGEANAAAYPQHTIVRTCGLYGHPDPEAKAPNFVDTMLRLGRERDSLRIVGDQHCTPSYVRHVARAVCFLARERHFGTYHVVNEGETTWFDLAAAIFELANLAVQLERITTAEYGAPAPRPSYSVLDTSKYRALGGPVLPHWSQGLREYLATRGVLAA